MRAPNVLSLFMDTAPSHPPSEIEASPTGDRLDSWKEIAVYLKRSVRTLHRWEKEEGLPVHRQLHKDLGSIFAYKSELDAWSSARSVRAELKEETDERASPKRSVIIVAVTLAAAVGTHRVDFVHRGTPFPLGEIRTGRTRCRPRADLYVLGIASLAESFAGWPCGCVRQRFWRYSAALDQEPNHWKPHPDHVR